MNVINEQINDTDYLYVVYGVIPELMPPVAYRRINRAELVERKLIRCANCREYLFDVDKNVLVRIYTKPKKKKHKEIPGQIFKKCNVCKNEVGIIMCSS